MRDKSEKTAANVRKRVIKIRQSSRISLLKKKHRKRRREATVVSTIQIQKKKLEAAVKLLEEPLPKRRETNAIDKNCVRREESLLWESPMLIVRHIRRCILTQNWSKITDLLLHLIKKKKRIHSSYIKEISFLNFLIHAREGHEDILDDFIKLCFVRIGNTTSVSKYDVWFNRGFNES